MHHAQKNVSYWSAHSASDVLFQIGARVEELLWERYEIFLLGGESKSKKEVHANTRLSGVID